VAQALFSYRGIEIQGMAADSDTGMPSETRRTGRAHYVSHLFRVLAERAVGFGDRLSLRSKFLLSLVVVIVAMTTCTLFAVRELIQVRAERQMEQDTRTSVLTFQEISQQQRMALSRKADLLATLAVLR